MENSGVAAGTSPLQTVAQSLGQLSRQKYWSELNQDEKMERMREVIKSLISRVERAESNFHNLSNTFANHGHLNGKVVKDIKTNEISGSVASKSASLNSNEVYF